ncbi:MAG: DUF6427 family protein [Bacteroidota bacterium]
MIASVFSKSKPINFVIVAAFIVFFVGGISFGRKGLDNLDIWENLNNIFVLLFSLFLLDFINAKSGVTQKNAYAILFFGLITALLPEIIDNSIFLWSNLFVLLALRRLISLQSRKYVKKKLFDASFWITIAAVLNPWSFLFYILVIVALIYYSGNDIKTIMTPIVGIICVLMLKVCYNIISFDNFIIDSDFYVSLHKNWDYFLQKKTLFSLIPLMVLVIWSVMRFIFSLKDRNAQNRPSYILVFLSLIVSLLVGVLSIGNDGGSLVFCLVPATLIIALSVEKIQRSEYVNAIITLFLILPIIKLFV